MTTSPPVATRDQIVWRFLNILATCKDWRAINWGTDMERPSIWEIIGTDTYINGVMLEVDRDYEYGYLLEVVDRTSSVVSYHAVVAFHGPRLDSDGDLIRWEHDSSVMDENVGTFFDRSVDSEQACKWAVRQIFGLMESRDDARKAKARQ